MYYNYSYLVALTFLSQISENNNFDYNNYYNIKTYSFFSNVNFYTYAQTSVRYKLLYN